MADSRLIPASIRDVSTFALNELIDRLGTLDITPLLVYLVDDVSASALPHLAEQFHVTAWEGWSLADSDTDRRELIKNAIALHRKKGTPWAIKQALTAMGYGGASLTERLATVYADGTVFADGAIDGSGGLRWALFRARVDLGENKPFNIAEKSKVLAAIDEYKPARSHLYALDIGSDVVEHSPINDEVTPVAARLAVADSHLPGLRCDGSVTASGGIAWLCNGEIIADGNHYPLLGKATGITPNNVLDPLGMTALRLNNGSDQQRVWLLCDGSGQADGTLVAGGSSPVALDPPMSIRVTRPLRANGRYRASGQIADGSIYANGAYSGGTHHIANGDIITYLEGV